MCIRDSSKAQEALGLVIQPFIAGFRRIASAESAPEAAKSTLVQLARRRIRRFIFSANRTMWFSACELGVFLTTDDCCVRTECTIKVFSGKGIAMMHACKRLLNHSTAAEGLLLARMSTQGTKVGCAVVEASLWCPTKCLTRISFGYPSAERVVCANHLSQIVCSSSYDEILGPPALAQVVRANHLSRIASTAKHSKV